MSGTLRYKINIGVSGTPVVSPTTIWSVNVYSCSQKIADWINTPTTSSSVNYDVRNPPTSSVIATYAYLGPPFAPCGNPNLTIANDATGASLTFLTATYDSVSRNIAISLPNNNTAVKGIYTLRVAFTQPGNFNFSLGIGLTVFDSCENSTFDSAPALTNDNQCYYANQGDLIVTASYTNYVSRTTGLSCGPYNIIKKVSSSTLLLNDAPLLNAPNFDSNMDETRFKFATS